MKGSNAMHLYDPEDNEPLKPRLEDYNDISLPEIPLCPSCSSPLMGPSGTLQVFTLTESIHNAVGLTYGDGKFRVVADPESYGTHAHVEVAACSSCGQAIDAAIGWA